jgi:hypothetical protein
LQPRQSVPEIALRNRTGGKRISGNFVAKQPALPPAHSSIHFNGDYSMNTKANNTHTALDEFELINSATDYTLKRAPNGWISGYFYQCELTSVFQPIFSTGHGKTVGHAAYVRSKSNEEIALWPWQVFAMASKDDQLIELDRLCRAVHALNYYFNHIPNQTICLSRFIHACWKASRMITAAHLKTFST